MPEEDAVADEPATADAGSEAATDSGSEAGCDAGADAGADASGGGNACPMCGANMFKRHCKYVCPQHGVVVDCSDPFSF